MTLPKRDAIFSPRLTAGVDKETTALSFTLNSPHGIVCRALQPGVTGLPQVETHVDWLKALRGLIVCGDVTG
jgi:hypothetical protein